MLRRLLRAAARVPGAGHDGVALLRASEWDALGASREQRITAATATYLPALLASAPEQAAAVEGRSGQPSV